MLPHLLRERSLRGAARFGDNQLRRNFFRCISFETIFTFARIAVRQCQGHVHPARSGLEIGNALHLVMRTGGTENFFERHKTGGRKQRSRLAAARRSRHRICQIGKSGAGEGIRTLDPDLGKVVLYH
jgi:hypothetical protein